MRFAGSIAALAAAASSVAASGSCDRKVTTVTHTVLVDGPATTITSYTSAANAPSSSSPSYPAAPAAAGGVSGAGSAAAAAAGGASGAVSSAAAIAAAASGSASASVSAAAAAVSANAVSKTKSASSSAANSGIKGFNYGAFFLNQQAKVQSDFAYEFNRAQNLPGTTGWNSARLYSMIQWGTASDVIQAIPAAIETNTNLLLGLWISGSDEAITNEITALKAAISTYGTSFTDLVQGISVGSEDLYRDMSGEVGTSADYLISCISKVRSAIAGTALAGTPVGHVDTYDAFLNGTNAAVVPAVDWLGFDGYPYWESALPNSIDDAPERFYSGLNKTLALAGDKPVYVTETGWPVSGDDQNLAVASPANARQYWTDIACTLIASGVNVWWYDLQESQDGQASPDFGIYPAGDLNQVTASYELSCVRLALRPVDPVLAR
ncbi:glycoside hydrolase superfamily [Xylariaceae sp. FL0804]|nr:glycoside hydrolase superfamily [Xylariaceae sp. FL0804]